MFRLELSYDCATFRPLVDGLGSNVVNCLFYNNVDNQYIIIYNIKTINEMRLTTLKVCP